MMQREEKARLSQLINFYLKYSTKYLFNLGSNETIEKLIENVARNIRENKEHELTRR